MKNWVNLMEEIRELLTFTKLSQLIKYCDNCLDFLVELNNGSEEDEESIQKMEVTKNFLTIVADKFVNGFQQSVLSGCIEEPAVQDLKSDLASDAYYVIQAILTCTVDLFVNTFDEIEDNNGFEGYETKRDEAAEREIIAIIHHFSENTEGFGITHQTEEIIPNMDYKISQLREQYINSGWYNEMGLRDYVDSLAEDDQTFWGWLFDNPALNGLLSWQLTHEQRECYNNFLTFLNNLLYYEPFIHTSDLVSIQRRWH